MKTKYSNNKKLNTLLFSIENQLLNMCDTQADSISEVKRYAKEYKNEPDYGLVQYGWLLIYYADVRDFFSDCGYKVANYSDLELWNYYKRNVGFVARQIVNS